MPGLVGSLSDSEIFEALATVLDAAGDLVGSLRFCLVGTASSRVRGIPLPVGDVEFVAADRHTVDALFARISADLPRLPVEHAAELQKFAGRGRATDLWFYAAAWRVEGVSIGWATCEPVGGMPRDPMRLSADVRAVHVHSDVYECLGRAPWIHSDVVQVGDHAVCCVATELRLVSELVRERGERYDPIFDYLEDRPFDRDLLARAVTARVIDATKRFPRLARLIA